MAGKRVKKEGKTKTSSSFGISLIIVAIIAIAAGYFLGNYFIKMAIAPANTTSQAANTRAVKAPVEPKPVSETVEPLPVVAETSKPTGPAADLLVKLDDDNLTGTAITPAAAEPVVSDGLLRVQVGAFATRPEAMTVAQQLQADGYQTYITTEKPYRVQVGAFADQAAAKGLVDQLISHGYSQVIIK